MSTLTVVDRLLQPLNRLSSKRFLREARQKVWHNTVELQRARLVGEREYAVAAGRARGAQRSAHRRPSGAGQVLLRLAVAGFGVTLPPARLA